MIFEFLYNKMIAGIESVPQKVRHMSHQLLHGLRNLFFYNFINIEEIALKNEKGVGLATLGIGKRSFHFAILRTQKPELFEKQLTIMANLPEPEARGIYQAYDDAMGFTFFLGQNDANAYEQRKKIYPYFHPKKLTIHYTDELNQLLYEYSIIANNQRYCPYNDLIHKHTLRLLCKTMAGFQLDDESYRLLLKLKVFNPNGFVTSKIFPANVLRYLPGVRAYWRGMSSLQTHLNAFLKDQIQRVIRQDDRGKHWLGDSIRELFPNKSFEQITDAEVEQLCLHPQIRTGLGIVIGADNLAHALQIFFDRYFAVNPKLVELKRIFAIELSKIHFPITEYQAELLNKNKFPILHAIYLEIMRLFTQGDFGITRYTKDGIENESLSIPPNTIIAMPFKQNKINTTDANIKPNEFFPGRFLTKANKLNFAADFKGNFHPFSSGQRACPGMGFTEYLLKRYIVGMEQTVLSCDYSKSRWWEFALKDNAWAQKILHAQILSVVDEFKEDVVEIISDYVLEKAEVVTKPKRQKKSATNKPKIAEEKEDKKPIQWLAIIVAEKNEKIRATLEKDKARAEKAKSVRQAKKEKQIARHAELISNVGHRKERSVQPTISSNGLFAMHSMSKQVHDPSSLQSALFAQNCSL